MYDRMRGELEDLTPTFAVLQVGGISYEIAVPLSTFNALKGEREARRVGLGLGQAEQLLPECVCRLQLSSRLIIHHQ